MQHAHVQKETICVHVRVHVHVLLCPVFPLTRYLIVIRLKYQPLGVMIDLLPFKLRKFLTLHSLISKECDSTGLQFGLKVSCNLIENLNQIEIIGMPQAFRLKIICWL